MLHLITGGTGDGKTLYAITEVLLDGIKANREAHALPPDHPKWEPLREFRTNIKGVRIPGVLPLEKDWRQYPDGTICVYDESHKKGWFRTTGKPGLSDDDVITELDEHRHRGFDIWFITQFPTKIHHEIRQLVKHHVHLVRSHGMQRSMKYEWQKCVNNPEDDEKVQKLEGEIWEFRNEGFTLYDSASMHTHKLQVPKALKRALVMVPVLLLVLWAIWYFVIPHHDAVAKEGEAAPPGRQALAAPGAAPAAGGERGSRFPPGMEWATAEVVPKFKGCAALSAVCRCWNGRGEQLLLDEVACRELATKPLPVDFSEAERPTVYGPGGQVAVGEFGKGSMDFPNVPAPGAVFSGATPRIGDVMPGVIEAARR